MVPRTLFTSLQILTRFEVESFCIKYTYTKNHQKMLLYIVNLTKSKYNNTILYYRR